MWNIELGQNPLWLIPCMVVAGGFSLFLYFKNQHRWPKRWNQVLSALRFLAIFLILLLLLNPVIKNTVINTQKPHIQIVIDNSESMIFAEKDIKNQVIKTLANLKKIHPETSYEIIDLEGETIDLDSLEFSQKYSNGQKALKNSDKMAAGKNHVATIFLSDGISNEGQNFENIISTKSIHTIGFGQNIQRKDALIVDVFLNKYTFKKNEFPISASVQVKGYKGIKISVECFIAQKSIGIQYFNVESDNDLLDCQFRHSSSEAGILPVTVKVKELQGELTFKNNQKTAFINVKDGRRKIGLIASSPHPDLKVIKTSIEKMDKYEVIYTILSHNKPLPDLQKIDAFILHQFPSFGSNQELYKKIIESKKPRWYFVGKQSDIPLLNRYLETVELRGLRGFDEVTGVLINNFDFFGTEDLNFDFLNHTSPLLVPYCDPKLKGNAQSLFEQQIGETPNGKPLLVYGNNSVKEAVFIGEGLWRWKITEASEYEIAQNFDLLISKMMSLIDGNEIESQFEVRAQKQNYFSFEKVSLGVIIKNNIGELAYENTVNLELKKDGKSILKSGFKVSENDPFYKLNTLEPGIYDFSANTQVAGKKLSDYGSFTVSNIEKEALDLEANWPGLQALSTQSGGKFTTFDDKEWVEKFGLDKAFPSKISSYDEEKFLNNFMWALAISLLLLSLEWLTRKYFGET